METVQLCFGLVVGYLVPMITAPPNGFREYCQTETFRAECAPDEVIVMRNATYGRMRLGRCVLTGYGHVGCQANVLRLTDRVCSGRNRCEIHIPDARFDATKPCPVEFKSYFEVDYQCLKVETATSKCQMSREIAPQLPSGYLSSAMAEAHGYGSRGCPWRIKLPPGQRVNITLMDFSTPDDANKANRRFGANSCNQYGTITERSSVTRNVRICGGSVRNKPVYVSRSNDVEIHLITRRNVDMEYQFLVKYEAIGCVELVAPRRGWLRKDGDGVTLGCNHTGHTWHMVCDNNRWKGPSLNCTPVTPRTSMVSWGNLSLPYEMSIGIIIGLAAIVGVIILLVGLICIEWKKMSRARHAKRQAIEEMHQQRLAEKNAQYYQRTSTYVPEPPAQTAPRTPEKHPRDNEYSYVREMWPLAPPPVDNVNGQDLHMYEQQPSEQNTPSSFHYGYSPGGTLSPDSDDEHIYESPRELRRQADLLGDCPTVPYPPLDGAKSAPPKGKNTQRKS